MTRDGRLSSSRRSLPFQIHHQVHQVLQNSGPGQGAVLGHMPGQKNRNVPHFGPTNQAKSTFPDLNHAARTRGRLRGIQSLHRIYNDQGRPALFQPAQNQLHIGFRQQIYPLAGKTEALGA